MTGMRLTSWAMAQRIRIQIYVWAPDATLHSSCSRSEKQPDRYPPRRLFVCLFVCWLLAWQPPLGKDLLIHEVSRSHYDAPQSVALLWTSDQIFAETLYLTTHNTHNRQTSVPPVGFEPSTPAGDRLQTALDRATTGIGTRTLRDN
jgi:hypothetical protein